MEANIFRMAHIDADIHRAKEEVGLVAEADFGVGILYRISAAQMRRLSAQADTNRGIRPEEIFIDFVAGVYAVISSIKEEIRAIAETHFGVGEF